LSGAEHRLRTGTGQIGKNGRWVLLLGEGRGRPGGVKTGAGTREE